MLIVLNPFPVKTLPLTQVSWVTAYLKTLTWNRFTASAAKRISVTSAEYVLIRTLVPGAFASSLTYLATSTTGTVSKNLVSYYMNSDSNAQHGSILVPVHKSDLEAFKQELKQADQKWQWRLSTVAHDTLKKAIATAVNGCFSVLDITYEDLYEGIGGTVGSTVASGAFIAYMGPPSLFILPLYFLTEGFCKSVGAFFGKMCGKHLLGKHVVKPAIKNAWQSYHQLNDIEDLERLCFELEELNLSDDIPSLEETQESQELLNAWYLMKECPIESEPEPNAHFIQNRQVQIMDDYDGITQKPKNPLIV